MFTRSRTADPVWTRQRFARVDRLGQRRPGRDAGLPDQVAEQLDETIAVPGMQAAAPILLIDHQTGDREPGTGSRAGSPERARRKGQMPGMLGQELTHPGRPGHVVVLGSHRDPTPRR
jgi:hypothetical protein